ncbi:MAG: BamA/TamA family outer membrane protein [Polyangiaceae bacterium]|nr:BamA/TamA family outer membrane protein [Polyangiaceae bacterium]
MRRLECSRSRAPLRIAERFLPPLTRAASGLILVCGLSSCVRQPYPAGRDIVSDVELEHSEPVDEDVLLDGLSTTASKRFLGIWDGVAYDYETLDKNVLARDLERVERYYRARGYYQAKVTAARVIELDKRHVRVVIRVDEGLPVYTREVTITGIERLPFDDAFAAQRAITLMPCGTSCASAAPFDEEQFEQTKAEIVRVLANRGYAFARVTAQATVNVTSREATAAFDVEPGVRAVYGPIRIVGLREIPEGPVRDSLLLLEGRPYSLEDIEDAHAQLVNLGVFSTVSIEQDKSDAARARVPLTVRVEEASLRTVRAGLGARVDQLEVTSTMRAGWEDRNFLGGMRRLQVDTRPGLTYFPTRFGNFVAPTQLLPHNRFRSELRQPSFLEGRTSGSLSTEYNVYPLLFPLPEGINPDKELVIGYHELRAAAGVQRPFFSHHLFVGTSYNWQANFPFLYKESPDQSRLPAGLGPVRVSYPELITTLDFRDDPLHVHKGVLFSNSLQVAGHIFGGLVSDVRVRPELRAYLPLSRTVTLALRSGFGFLFPSDYGQTLTARAPTGIPVVIDDPRSAAVVRDQHKLLFRAFYSGGPISNRGYGFREVGPQGPVGFLLQSGTVDCFRPRSESERAQCVRPLGGVALWEASLEVRFPIVGPLGGVVFADASDVTRTLRLRLTAPHLSPGFGLRYDSPIGPIRADAGYRLLEHIGPSPPSTELQDEARTRPLFGVDWLPIAVHIALGEAF